MAASSGLHPGGAGWTGGHCSPACCFLSAAVFSIDLHDIQPRDPNSGHVGSVAPPFCEPSPLGVASKPCSVVCFQPVGRCSRGSVPPHAQIQPATSFLCMHLLTRATYIRHFGCCNSHPLFLAMRSRAQRAAWIVSFGILRHSLPGRPTLLACSFGCICHLALARDACPCCVSRLLPGFAMLQSESGRCTPYMFTVGWVHP